MQNETARAFIHLANLQFSPRLVWSLLANFENDPCRAIDATDAEREEIVGWLPRHTERFHDRQFEVSTKQWDWFQAHPSRILLNTEPEYPPLLKEIHDPPPFLFVSGDYGTQYHLSVAIVGSRRATPYGRGVAEQMARELSQHGITILSGGAAGIDTAAHKGAITAQGRTVAVLGCGVDVCYPQENRALFEQIAKQGALLSEYPYCSPPETWRFPARNRIISGMAQALLIVEAPKQSGALITARFAAEHGRPLFVTPGNIDRPMSIGSNELLREGALPALDSTDILTALRIVPVRPEKAQQTQIRFEEGIEPTPKQTRQTERTYTDLDPTLQKIMACLSDTPEHVDQIADSATMESILVGVQLTILEINGFVTRLPGNTWVRRP